MKYKSLPRWMYKRGTVYNMNEPKLERIPVTVDEIERLTKQLIELKNELAKTPPLVI